MPNTTESAKLTSYIRSLKEVEALLIKSLPQNPEGLDGALPEPFREVCHMARIAPALLQCLAECKSLLEQTHSALSRRTGATSESEQRYLETMSNVLFSSNRVIEVALAGAIPATKKLH